MNIEDKELAQLMKSQKRKDIIKNITIVFLLLLLALTFFSRTIMNITLPEVATHVVAQGEVSPRIRGAGTAEIDDPYQVTVTQARKIKSVAVQVNQDVKRGDVIYYLEDTESEELRTARQELEDQQASFTKRLFDGSLSDSDITRMRAGNYRSDDQLQAELASINRRYESASKESASANREYEKLSAQSSGEEGSGASEVEDPGSEKSGKNSSSGKADTTKKSTAEKSEEEEEEEEEEEGSEFASTDFTSSEGYLEIQKTSLEKKLEKANNRKIDAEAEYSQVEKERDKVINSISAELELKGIQDAINKAQAKVDRLEKEEIGATITAPVDGKVTSLSYTAGEMTAADSPVAIIKIQGKKLTVSFSVKKEQAQKLKVGDEAKPQNPWEYGEEFTAVLRQITADTSDPQNSRLLKFEIDSEAVSAGDNVQLQLAESSKTYDLVVPNSAIRNDANGYFVLILQTKQSPIGNRYIVRRENIKILARDDTNCAISGAIGAYTYVVTNSTKSITAGDQVRLAEEVEEDEE